MRETAFNRQAGFTLIEVLVALSIFAIGLLAIAGMQLTALKSNSYAYSITAINAVASGVMEKSFPGLLMIRDWSMRGFISGISIPRLPSNQTSPSRVEEISPRSTRLPRIPL